MDMDEDEDEDEDSGWKELSSLKKVGKSTVFGKVARGRRRVHFAYIIR